MKEYYTYITNTGEIATTGYISGGDPYVSPNQTLVKGKQSTPMFYHNLETGNAELRPQLQIENTTTTVNAELMYPTIPAGTEITVDGELVGTVDANGLELVFPVAKSYIVDLKPPFPYIKKTVTIEATL